MQIHFIGGKIMTELLFFNNIRFQIAAAAVLIIIIVDYIRNPHLKLMSTKCFHAMLVSVACNLVLDITTVYTITHMDTVPAAVNKICHQFFFASVLLVMLFIYMYIMILSHNQKRLTKKQLAVVALPLAVSAAVIAGGRLEYYYSDTAAYSYGPMANVLYVCGTVYLLLTLAVIYSCGSSLTRYQKVSVQMGIFIWIGIMLIQLLNHSLLISGLGLVFMVLCIYFSFENQRENHDSETQCFNRGAFHRQMDEYYQNRKPLYIVNFSVENYDRINTLLGHECGKKALLHVKSSIETYLEGDIFHSRSSMFTMFFIGEAPDSDKLYKIRTAAQSRIFTETGIICHINLIDLRRYTEHTDEAYELMTFMKEYQRHGGEHVCVLDDEIIEKKYRRDKIDKLLAEAVKTNGFEMVYQPIFCTKEGKFRSAEALVRMKNTGDLGFVSPEEFIPIAEEKGMIMDIGDITLRLVADFAKRSALDKRLEYIEVNLSGIQACAPELESRLTKITAECGIAPSFINLEITETAALDSGETFSSNVCALRNSGFSFSMDDFGTGYSNLSQMNQMRYDLVKMDKSIIWDAFGKENEKAERLLASVISLLKAINVKIVAEGVETKEMTDYLTEKGVDYLQGYYFSRPVNEEKFLEIISA